MNVYSEWNPDTLLCGGTDNGTHVDMHVNSLFMPNDFNSIFLRNRLRACFLKEYNRHLVRTGYTPLLHAVQKGSMFFLKLLLNAGASVNTRNKYGYTPLMRAAMEGHICLMKPLIEEGADVNAMNRNGETALMCAVRELDPLNGLRLNHQHLSGEYKTDDTWPDRYLNYILNAVKILLRSGCHVNIVNNCGQNALEFHVAETNVHSRELAMLLLAAGENVHSTVLERFGPFRTLFGSTTIVPEYLLPGFNLKSLCRDAVRRNMLVNPVNLFLTLPTLGLPSLILNYLLYDISLDSDKG